MTRPCWHDTALIDQDRARIRKLREGMVADLADMERIEGEIVQAIPANTTPTAPVADYDRVFDFIRNTFVEDGQ